MLADRATRGGLPPAKGRGLAAIVLTFVPTTHFRSPTTYLIVSWADATSVRLARLFLKHFMEGKRIPGGDRSGFPELPIGELKIRIQLNFI